MQQSSEPTAAVAPQALVPGPRPTGDDPQPVLVSLVVPPVVLDQEQRARVAASGDPGLDVLAFGVEAYDRAGRLVGALDVLPVNDDGTGSYLVTRVAVTEAGAAAGTTTDALLRRVLDVATARDHVRAAA